MDLPWIAVTERHVVTRGHYRVISSRTQPLHAKRVRAGGKEEQVVELYEELAGIIDAFSRAELDYALCGGLAVAFYGYPRFTADIDVLLQQDDLRRALELLDDLGFNFVAERMTFGTVGIDERVVHRVSKIEDDDVLTLDLLIVGPSLEGVWKGRELFEWQGRKVKVVSLEGLAKMKRLAGRTKDKLDLENLGISDHEQ